MKIAIQSDLHLEHNLKYGLPYQFLEKEHDVLVLAGDISVASHPNFEDHLYYIRSSTDAKIVYVPGNHEYYGVDVSICSENPLEHADARMKRICEQMDITFLNNSSVEIDGVSFFGSTLWSYLLCDEYVEGYGSIESRTRDLGKRIADFRAISGWSTESMFSAYKKALANLEKFFDDATSEKKVVISHFPPVLECEHRLMPKTPISAYFVNNLGDLIMKNQPDVWIYGHTHDSIRLTKGKCLITSNQMCYPGENKNDYRPDYIINL